MDLYYLNVIKVINHSDLVVLLKLNPFVIIITEFHSNYLLVPLCRVGIVRARKHVDAHTTRIVKDWLVGSGGKPALFQIK